MWLRGWSCCGVMPYWGSRSGLVRDCHFEREQGCSFLSLVTLCPVLEHLDDLSIHSTKASFQKF